MGNTNLPEENIKFLIATTISVVIAGVIDYIIGMDFLKYGLFKTIIHIAAWVSVGIVMGKTLPRL